ncbi:MAG: cation:proton antiporter [Dehalococcoidia bacterium]
MTENLLIGLASIIILGIGAQWLAWRFQLPAILLMLAFGIIAGPVLCHFYSDYCLDPDELFGDLLLPIVSLSVAIILFEGGLSLRISELRGLGSIIPRLITIGALATWVIGAAASYYLLDLELDIAILLGAILIVSGPTVILPLLRHVRPRSQINSVLKWEGIVIDPIGAILAVIVFQEVLGGSLENATQSIVIGILKTIFFGTATGIVGAYFILAMLKRYWIPDFLQSSAVLMIVIAVYIISDHFQEESGLMATTIMGIVMGNQKSISVRHIIEFKEHLGVLLVSSLFVLLAARLDPSDWNELGWNTVIFLLVLIFVARPLAVVLSTMGSNFNWRERAFLMWVAPRGIVAAAVSSVFALRLADAGHPQASQLVPLTFTVILVTVIIYGLSAFPLARRLQISQANPQGFLIMGAHPWARTIASTLKENGYKVLLVDTAWVGLMAARNAGLDTFHASILSRYALDEIDLGEIGRLLALTPNNGANSLAALHFAPYLDSANVFQLSPGVEEEGRKEEICHQLCGRILFGRDITFQYLMERFRLGAIVKSTKITEIFDFNAFKNYYGPSAIPLFLINNTTGDITVFASDTNIKPEPGYTLISLVDPVEESGSPANG